MPVVQLCCTLVAWLTLNGGLSRRTANITLQSMRLIVITTIQVLFGVLRASGFNLPVPNFDLPTDVRSIYAQGLQPDITQTPCCPKCFRSYQEQNMPPKCTYKRSQRAKPCDAQLWKQRRTRNSVKQVPKCYYRTQSFESWLRFFLSRQDIEDHLEESFIRNSNEFQGAHTGPMHDIQDSPAWRTLRNYLKTRYHLVFSFYIDWFNPFTNKIAGEFFQVVS